ncbi:hypothetical protein IPE29_002623 [Salmonella enterica subsp. diarizonae serovar Rough:-:-]|nr:hypothetical protein [Salmonella enterica]EDS3651757.1 hypothetical protein [Salmonella enterica]EGO1765063.1 hypothetical protein [Salmonella enterica subsp. diarizonae serovar Rough:-:-]EJU5807251.1 Tar ligand binding domain-containing protein [Salmonella enterica]MDS72386.1 hypothetical protein [Salmonella enterica]
MFRQIKISYGLVAVLILLTIIQIISGSWSVMSYRDYDRNLQQIAFERARIALLDEAYVIISDTRGGCMENGISDGAGQAGGGCRSKTGCHA